MPQDHLLRTFPLSVLQAHKAPERFTFPFCYTPHPWAKYAAEEVMRGMHLYMEEHPDSELHKQGKMFGVLVVRTTDNVIGYLRAFSAMLDGTYHQDGFVEPIVDISNPEGYFKKEEAIISAINLQIRNLPKDSEEVQTLSIERKQRSQALQRWMFAEYQMLNGKNEAKNLLKIFENEKPIVSEEDYFQGNRRSKETIPPSGSGECSLPKLLQYAYKEHMKPLCMAEFWVGASTEKEIRIDGHYYPACLSRCKPILLHMLEGIDVEENPMVADGRKLAKQIDIIYEDDLLLVINKPSGMLSTPDKNGTYSVADWAKEYLQADKEPIVAHRLDQDTSGLLIIAKDIDTYTTLQKQFIRRDVKKRYEAVLCKYPKENEGIIDLPLLPNPFDRPRQMVDFQHGKKAITRYKVEQCLSDGHCIVSLYPETGRTHQLRVHCAHQKGLNAPIVGDRLYGQSNDRLMLCAVEISFQHPKSGDEKHFLIKGFQEL